MGTGDSLMQVYSRSAGKIIEVPDTQDGQTPQAPQSSALQQVAPQIASTVPQNNVPPTRTGHTLSEYQSAIQKAQAAGDAAGLKQLNSNYGDEIAYQKSLNAGDFSPKLSDAEKQKQKDEQTKADAKAKLASSAQALINTLDAGKSGKLTGQQYKDALNNAASKMAADVGFSQGGKALTGPELTILAGSMPIIQPRGMGIVDWINKLITGKGVAQTGQVADSEDTLRRKAMLASGTPLDKLPPDNQDNKSNLLQNAGNDIGGILNGILGGPAAGFKSGQQAGQKISQIQDPKAREQAYAQYVNQLTQSAQPSNIGVGAVKSQASEYNQLAGNPLEGGDIAGRIGQRAYEKPVTTALDVLSFLPFLKGLTALKGGQVADVASEVGNATKVSKVGEATSNMTGRALTQIAAPDLNSVSNSENIMKSVLQNTKAVTTRGIAKELENKVLPETGAKIDNFVTQVDKYIGPQSRDDVLGNVRQKLENTASGQANPELVDTVMAELKGRTTAGNLEGGMGKGEIAATNLTKMNETRKYLNNSLSNWFKNGNPVGTKTNDLNALRWEASSALKDTLAEADSSNGAFKTALDVQHNALKAKGVLANKALVGTQDTSIFKTLRNTLMGATEPLKIGITRKMVGKSGALDSVLKDLPQQAEAATPRLNPMVPNISATNGIVPNPPAEVPSGFSNQAFPQVDIPQMLKDLAKARTERAVLKTLGSVKGKTGGKGTRHTLFPL